MAALRLDRRPAAILAADVVGYMGEDEAGTRAPSRRCARS